MMATIPSVLPHIKANKLRVLATSGAKRSNMLPDTPTIAQSGVPGYSAIQWHGIVAPAGTPQQKIEQLHAELKAMVASDEGRRKLVTRTEVDFLGLGESAPSCAGTWTSGRSYPQANIKLASTNRFRRTAMPDNDTLTRAAENTVWSGFTTFRDASR